MGNAWYKGKIIASDININGVDLYTESTKV
jgi:hypothetical protein